MKFFLPLFAAGAIASSIGGAVKRDDGTTIASAIASVQSATQNLDSAVNAFSGASDAATVQASATALLNAINSADNTVKGVGMLTSDEAVSLVQPIQTFSGIVKTATTDVVNQKPKFDAASLGGIVYSNLLQIQSAATTLSNDIVSKVPSSLQSTAQGLAGPISQDLANAVNAYKSDANQSGSVSSGSASTTSASASSSASVAPTTTSAAATTTTAAPSSSAASTAPVATYTGNGAAPTGVAGFGVAAMAAIAAVAAL